MLGALDHVGYLATDLDAAIAECEELLGVEVQRRFERPQFELLGAYLGADGAIELFTFTDAELLARRSAGRAVSLDHVAYEVKDIEATARRMASRGVRFSGADLRGELSSPVDLGGVLHLWTVPETCGGQAIQLLQR